MTPVLQTTLILLTLLQVKHLFADFFLQTPRMLADRSIYIHTGRAQHAGIHALLSFVSFMLVGAPAVFTVILCLLEWVVHYHIDWAKGRHADKTREGPEDPGYWRAFGIDQMMHQLTYVAMLWMWIVFGL